MNGNLATPYRKDQATRLRHLMRTGRSTTMTLAITSGKGGVGKTNIAVNLSICLAARGLRVTLVDVDMGLANADLLLNVHPRYTLSHVLSGVRTIEGISIEGPAGLRFVPGASGVESLANLSEFERRNLISQLQKLETSTDILVLDCGAGISRNVISFALAADQVLVITTPEPTALTDAYAMIKSIHRECHSVPMRLLVNMAASRAQARAVHERLAGVAKRFLNYSVADNGYMLHDKAVELAVQARQPFVIRSPESNASVCMAAIADRVAGRRSGLQRAGGFFERVVRLFA